MREISRAGIWKKMKRKSCVCVCGVYHCSPKDGNSGKPEYGVKSKKEGKKIVLKLVVERRGKTIFTFFF